MIEHLSTRGANVNEKDAYGDTPLHYACFCGHLSCVEKLIERGANPMQISTDGKTPIQSAHEEGHAAIVETLKKRGASLATPAGATTGPARTAPLKAGAHLVSAVAGSAAGPHRSIAGLDFSTGVLMEGELRKKRANKLQKWRRKYYIMSSTYGALFFWTGDDARVEGVIKKVRFETFFAVRQFPDKHDGKRFDIQVVTGRTMSLMADSVDLVRKWVACLKLTLGPSMATLRIQTAWRGFRARKQLKMVKSMRSDIVRKGAAAIAASAASSPVLIEGALKKKNSKISASLLSAFRTRYFVLDVRASALLYFKSKAARNLGELPARIPIVSFLGAEVVTAPGTTTPTPRFFLRVTAGRVFVFEAPDAAEAAKWVSALHRAMPRDNIAAICIQRHARGMLARKRFAAAKADTAARSAAITRTYAESSGKTEPEVRAAALQIQRVGRGAAGRRLAAKRRLLCRRKLAAKASRLYLKTRKRRGSAAPPPKVRSQAQESRMQRLMRLKAAKAAKAAAGDGGAVATQAAGTGSPLPPPPPPPPSEWVKHTDADSGRPYWFNATTQETTWMDPSLPRFGDWIEITDDDGDTFYSNAKTGESQWDAPAEFVAAKQAAAAGASLTSAKALRRPPDWVAQKNPDDGTVFYAHQNSGESQWDKPDGFDAQFPPQGVCFEWTRVQDDDGDVYYFDNRSGEATWDRPDGFEGPEHSSDASGNAVAGSSAAAEEKEEEEDFDPSAWEALLDPVSNKQYWFNAATGESRWSIPAPAAAAAAASGAGESAAPAAAAASADGPDPAEVLTFTSWVNETLASHPGQLVEEGAEGAAAAAVGWLAGRLPLDLDADPPALFDTARNGVMLAKLVNAVGSSLGDGMAVDERALEVDAAPKSDDDDAAAAGEDDMMMGDFFFFANAATNPALENSQLALSTARAVGALVPASVTAKQISQGDPGAVLDMVWALWKRSLTDTVSVRARPEAVTLLDAAAGEELGDLLRLRPEQLLVRWVNHQLDLAEAWSSDARCSGFGAELADGRMLAAIVRQLASDEEHKSYLPSDDAAMDGMSVADLAGNTIWVASRLGVPEWFSVEAITSGNVRLQIAFVAMLWQKVEGSMGEKHSAQLERRRRSSVMVRRRTMGARDMAAVRRKLASLIREEEDDADAETISRETRVHRQWVNSLGLPGVAVHDLAADVRDGVILLLVLDKIEPGLVSWKKAHRKPRNRYQKVENCNAALRVCEALDMRIVNLSGPDIAAGNPKLVAAVVWQMMRHHTLRILSSVAFKGFDVTESQVLEWANARLDASEKLSGFSDSRLATSVPLLRVMHSVRPCVDWSLVTEGKNDEDRKSNAQYLLSVARKMGAAAFCTWEDIVQVKPKMIMTVVASAIVVDQRTRGGAEAEAAARAAAEADDLDDDDFATSTKVERVADFADSEDDDDDDDEGAAAASASGSSSH